MTFGMPWVLLALLLLPVLVLTYRSAWTRVGRERAALARTGLRPVGRAGGTGRLRHVAPGLLLASLGLLTIAAAIPSAVLTQTRTEGTVILAFDVSNSMRADDVDPDRLSASKSAARAFVAEQPRSIRIGLIAFSDTGILTQPPSDDPATVTQAIDRLTPRGGTSLGQGIFASLEAISGGKLAVDPEQLAKDPESIDIGYYGSASIVLLSDGQDESQVDPVAMARLASVAGVRIDTVGIGSPQGTSVTVDGVTQETVLDPTQLREIAKVTGGRYHPAADAQALTEVYRSIDLTEASRRESTGLAPYFMIAASLLAVGAMALSLVRAGRVIAA